MIVTTLPIPVRALSDRVAVAASHMYDAEFALHAAHGSHVDAWIMAASDRLHAAVLEHTAACAALQLHTPPDLPRAQCCPIRQELTRQSTP